VARKSLKPQLNQIRAWVRQGRTDAWIAHQLAVSVKDITEFKREQNLVSDESEPANANEHSEEVDLRAEDDALVAAELAAEPPQGATQQQPPDDAAESQEQLQKRRRRRGRRGGRGRRATRNDKTSLEATFDHGQDGYGLWLDPAVADDPIYIDHWAGHRSVSVTVEPDRIIIQRTGQADPPSQDEKTENNTADSD
jgi:hypothetical protein